MKFRMLRLGQLVSHNSAMYHQTSRQLSQTVVLDRAATNVCGVLRRGCYRLEDDGKLQKADLPVENPRGSPRAAVGARAKHGTSRI